MLTPLRIGAVPYVNAWPLTFGLAERADVRLRLAEPSALAPLLCGGEVDVALVPAIEYFRLSADSQERARGKKGTGVFCAEHPEGRPGKILPSPFRPSPPSPPRFVVLPVAAIGSRGRCGSVRLFGWAEMEKVRRVLLDPASRTSNALARLLLGRQFGVRAHYVFPGEAGPVVESISHYRAGAVLAQEAPQARRERRPDAELVIGDRGLVAERADAEWVLDLGREWDRFVRHPFVFAVWAARADAPLADAVRLLAEARDAGLEARDALAERAERERGIPAAQAHQYLVHQVRYAFGRKERQGLAVFYRMASEDGLAPIGGRLELGPEV